MINDCSQTQEILCGWKSYTHIKICTEPILSVEKYRNGNIMNT